MRLVESASRADVIVAGSNPITAAARNATATIPVVTVGTFDPVDAGLVANLARPGGNITGLVVDASPEMTAKNLSLLTEIIAGLSHVGVLRQVDHGKGLEGAARQLNVSLHFIHIGTLDELENAFATLSGKRVGTVMVMGPMLCVRRKSVAAPAIKYRLPPMHALREFAQAGLFVTYGATLADLYRWAAGYADRILKGARPGNPPVEQGTKFDLVINLNTAKLLGVAIPQSAAAACRRRDLLTSSQRAHAEDTNEAIRALRAYNAALERLVLARPEQRNRGHRRGTFPRESPSSASFDNCSIGIPALRSPECQFVPASTR